MSTFANHLREAIESSGKPNDFWAEKCELHRANFSKIVLGRRRPGAATAASIISQFPTELRPGLVAAFVTDELLDVLKAMPRGAVPVAKQKLVPAALVSAVLEGSAEPSLDSLLGTLAPKLRRVLQEPGGADVRKAIRTVVDLADRSQ